MFKNIAIAAMLVLFVLSGLTAYAEMAGVVAPSGTSSAPTQTNVNVDGQTNFEYAGVWGNSSTGNPGYLVMKGCDDSNACFPYYLWVDNGGNLVMASWATISTFASFPTGNWNNTNGFRVGSKVGSQ